MCLQKKRQAREREKEKASQGTRHAPAFQFRVWPGIDASTSLIEPALARGSSFSVLTTKALFAPHEAALAAARHAER
ncbi:uncharacterized protein SPSK_10942 [Sporothrix schenckii 1099-18]|uniref:Uncharacterized protein n=1 Tax=Sporothrix schenckii 1099-18 TaxID=1397361 RepID=A0A0F2M6W3_SPOSC|nr:uncharacterized protein SPSK_10942 [Sporothrix schenckii 1099-18]KJR84545.1 hypothetical protein SPSK_10942 [Sporothrix schenckii 1099-18]